MIAGYHYAEFHYRCRWCDREAIIEYRRDETTNNTPLEGWRGDAYGPVSLCSSDYERMRDKAVNEAMANLEPAPMGSVPPGFYEELERLRQKWKNQ